MRSISKEKNIPFDELLRLLEGALAGVYKRSVAAAAGGRRLEIRTEVGDKDIHIYSMKTCVRFVENPVCEIALTDAQKINPDARDGDEVEVEVTPANFGRVAVQTIQQVLIQRIEEYERERILQQFRSMTGRNINCHVSRINGPLVYLSPDGHRNDAVQVEALLPPAEQIRGEVLKPGAMVKAYVLELRAKKGGRYHELIVSRTHPSFLRRLLENEVEEIASGAVEIKALAREPGVRAKIAVSANDPNIDPVGACIGPMASRISAVGKALGTEKIDICVYSSDPAKFICQALAPERQLKVECDPAAKTATVRVSKNDVTPVIGKGGVNVKLAARLTGWKIDVAEK